VTGDIIQPRREADEVGRKSSPGKLGYVVAAISAGMCLALAAGTIASVLPHVHDRGTRFLAPGRADLVLPEAGDYSVYHEFESTYQGRRFSTGQQDVTSLVVTLAEEASGSNVRVWKPAGWATYKTGDCEGLLVWEFRVGKPGRYIISAQYPAAAQGSQVVLNVTKDDVVEMTLKAVIGGLGGLAFGLLAVVLALITAVRRSRVAGAYVGVKRIETARNGPEFEK